MVKKCRRCGVEKKETKFKVDKRQPDGRTVTCRECYSTRKLVKWFRTPEQIESQRKKLLGRKYSLEHRLKISRANKKRIEKGIHNFTKHSKGHKDQDRCKIEYKIWKEKLLEKAGNKCEICGSTKRLCGHHKKCYYKFPELRFDVDNGQILCLSCHQRLHTKGIPRRNISLPIIP